MYLKMKTNYMDISNLLDPIIFKTSPKCTITYAQWCIERCTKLYKQYNNYSIIIQINIQSNWVVFIQVICNTQFGPLFNDCSLYNTLFQRTSQMKTRYSSFITMTKVVFRYFIICLTIFVDKFTTIKFKKYK